MRPRVGAHATTLGLANNNLTNAESVRHGPTLSQATKNAGTRRCAQANRPRTADRAGLRQEQCGNIYGLGQSGPCLGGCSRVIHLRRMGIVSIDRDRACPKNVPNERANGARKCKHCKACNGETLGNAKVLIDKDHGIRFPS